MSFAMTGAVTGAPVSGLTTPTYTLTADSAVDQSARQSVVTALGGTQTGVNLHSVSSPFTVTVTRPRGLRTLGKPNLNGLISNVGVNTYRRIIRKGVVPFAGQPPRIAVSRNEYEVPAGSELADVVNLKAMISFAGGFDYTNADGLVATFANAVL